ncbi:MAG: hypothetical protein JNN08_10960 [Bryobacterales bacterium]|nr:hypothetical protein [Bryobacterales bacterium]
MATKVHIIGAYHSLHLTADNVCNGDRQRFLAILDAHLRGGVIVAEEAGEREDQSDAKKMASKRGAKYHNIDINEAAKVQIHYVRMSSLDCSEIKDVDERDNLYALAWNLAREWHMIETIQDLLRDNFGQDFLIIVGLSHLDAIRKHLPVVSPSRPIFSIG